MSMIFMIVAICCGLGSAYFLFDFLHWKMTGTVVRATIEGFEKKENRRGQLPVLSFQKENGEKVRVCAEKVVQLIYLFSKPETGFTFAAIYRDNPPEARIHGYLHLIYAGLLLIPVLAYLATYHGTALMASQVSFIITFVIVLLCGWMFLKFIQKNY